MTDLKSHRALIREQFNSMLFMTGGTRQPEEYAASALLSEFGLGIKDVPTFCQDVHKVLGFAVMRRVQISGDELLRLL